MIFSYVSLYHTRMIVHVYFENLRILWGLREGNFKLFGRLCYRRSKGLDV